MEEGKGDDEGRGREGEELLSPVGGWRWRWEVEVEVEVKVKVKKEEDGSLHIIVPLSPGSDVLLCSQLHPIYAPLCLHFTVRTIYPITIHPIYNFINT
jgi:hypothetical protein